MRTIINAIGYRSSKSDRAVLKWFFIMCLVGASAIGLKALLLFWSTHWNPQVKQDSARLDAILANESIDRVEFVSPLGNRLITGEEALKFVASLHKTNRIANIDSTKQQVQQVILLDDTNAVGRISLGDDGAWEFGNYGFRTR